MKRILTFALFVAIPLAAFATAPVVTIDNVSNVYVDGVNVGQPADAINNNPALAPAIQQALAAFVTQTKTAADIAVTAANTARDTAIAAKETEKQTAISAANAARDAAIAANAQELADAKTARDTAQQQLADANVRLDAAAAQITRLQQQVRSLGATPTQ